MDFTNIINHYYATLSSPFSPINNQSRAAIPSRTRITRACDHCQLRKTKCDSAKPRCSQCVKRGDPCTFNTRVSKRGPKPKRYTQSSYPIKNKNNVQMSKKSTNVYPYPNYFPVDTRRFITSNYNTKQSNYSQQPLTQGYNNITQDYSEFLKSEDFISQVLPPIKTSSSLPSSPSSPSFPTSTNGLTLPSLRLPSSSNNFKLPPISALLNGSNMSGDKKYFEKVEVSSPSYYRLNGVKRIPLNL